MTDFLFVAAYDGADSTHRYSLAEAQAYCNELAASENTAGYGIEWVSPEPGVWQQVWTHPSTDRTVGDAPGRVRQLQRLGDPDPAWDRTSAEAWASLDDDWDE